MVDRLLKLGFLSNADIVVSREVLLLPKRVPRGVVSLLLFKLLIL